MATQLLQQAEHNSLGITFEDAQSLLKHPDFLPELLAITEEGKDTILHLAAKNPASEVTVLVLEAYRTCDQVQEVLCMKNKKGDSPLKVAVKSSNAENVMLLYNECRKACPHIITEADDGFTILHQAVQLHFQSVNVTKFLLSQEECLSMLVSPWKGTIIPLDISKQAMVAAQLRFDDAKSGCEHHIKFAKMNDWSAENHRKFSMRFPKEQLERATEIYKLLELPSTEAKAQLAQKIVLEQERAKKLKKRQQILVSLQKLYESDRVGEIIGQYLCGEDDKDIQAAALQFLSQSVAVEQLTSVQLTSKVMVTMENLLCSSSGDTHKHCLKVLAVLTAEECNALLVISEKHISITSKTLDLLKSLNTDVQLYAATILDNLAKWCNEEVKPLTKEWIQPLLLLKCFSNSKHVQSVCFEALTVLGCTPQQQPDPGSWGVKDVAVWIDSMELLENKELYLKLFEEACIDGLHLLELSPTEMRGIGIKFVSEQRKLSNKIDELRRMNARSIVGHKDVFLSYAHVNINLARKVKNALATANYTVWIDEAGIRAGQKWRNEIADGIHDCKAMIFLMTARASNSEYCQDELGLAEELKKPIIALKLEDPHAMDPGIKLVIQRRQWIDFTRAEDFKNQCSQMIDALNSLIGPGSGPESSEESGTNKDTSSEETCEQKHTAHSGAIICEETVSGEDMAMLRSAVQELRREFSKMRAEYQESISLINKRLTAIENEQRYM